MPEPPGLNATLVAESKLLRCFDSASARRRSRLVVWNEVEDVSRTFWRRTTEPRRELAIHPGPGWHLFRQLQLDSLLVAVGAALVAEPLRPGVAPERHHWVRTVDTRAKAPVLNGFAVTWGRCRVVRGGKVCRE